ncbi:hypothetical protein IQ07DRAFT_671272 [Pyrenochaeta sp. DS3sAY3a]|nr:hypothetical protein IQ07DRAFT_671272 [Pyrenochaeta sp. DS3sAY3a]
MRAMFPCTECTKHFTSQGSLARHVQNHCPSSKHVCNACGVIFRRRDLLTRHLKLHEPRKAPSDRASSRSDDDNDNHNNNRTGIDAISRKRCHTACNRCRDLKIKCDGQCPCSRCQRARKPCDFDRPRHSSGRISHVHSTAMARASSSGSTSLAPSLSFVANAGDSSHMSMPVYSPVPFTDVDTGPIASGSFINHETDTTLAFPSLSWDAIFSQVTPWPWLHENLFLSGNNIGLHLAALQSPSAHNRGHDQGHGQSQAQNQQYVDTIVSCSDVNLDSAAAAMSVAPLAGLDVLEPPSSLPPDGDKYTRSLDENTACKERAAEALVNLAVHVAKGTRDKPRTYPKPINLWSQASQDLVACFSIELQPGQEHVTSTTEAMLQHFVRLYSEHFHQLWPLLPRRTLESGEMHPLLYLVLASIGAMYTGGSGPECGTFLHNAVRQRVVLPLELDDADDDIVWLAQARLLTQVAALYFGQPRAFSYAQHLGTLLTAQARRMCLFSNTTHQQRLLQLKKMKGIATDMKCLDLWLSIEERRRLAFGIFRGDTFTSVLLNIKPLVSLEEIALDFPACNSVFNSPATLDPRLALDMIEHHRTPYQDVRASDVFHVLLESNEMLPPLEPIAHEILLFGLQSHVWRFSFDRQLLERLTSGTGAHAELEVITGGDASASVEVPRSDKVEFPCKRPRKDTFTSELDSLDNRSYHMADLTAERQRLMVALAKWERALPFAKTLARNEEDRSYLLSSLILYHLSVMRLHALVEDIHQIHYRLADKQPVSHELMFRVIAWTRSARARIAVERVRSICSLITQETLRGPTRSRFNFNAYVGLHHGAAILWAYQGATDQDQINERQSVSSISGSLHLSTTEVSSPTSSAQPHKAESSGLLETFEQLFHAMSPARWSSFAEVARTLTTLVFPIYDSSVNEEMHSR